MAFSIILLVMAGLPIQTQISTNSGMLITHENDPVLASVWSPGNDSDSHISPIGQTTGHQIAVDMTAEIFNHQL